MLLPHHVLALVASFASCAASLHLLCSWRPGDLPPAAYGFGDHFCKADKVMTDNGSRAQWLCGNSKVADWNYLQTHKLEMPKACDKGGFAYKVFGGCRGGAFAHCLGDAGPSAPNITCFYKSAQDDCEWPDLFEAKDLPATIDVWVKEKHWRRDDQW